MVLDLIKNSKGRRGGRCTGAVRRTVGAQARTYTAHTGALGCIGGRQSTGDRTFQAGGVTRTYTARTGAVDRSGRRTTGGIQSRRRCTRTYSVPTGAVIHGGGVGRTRSRCGLRSGCLQEVPPGVVRMDEFGFDDAALASFDMDAVVAAATAGAQAGRCLPVDHAFEISFHE